jgi:exonuclease III
VRRSEKKGKLRFVSFNKGNEASHFFKNGKGSRLDLVAVSDAAENASAEKAAKVIQWRQELMTKANLPDTIDRISDHLPVISRFFFTDVD